MTTTDRIVTVEAKHKTDPSRWIRVTLGLRDTDGLGCLAHAAVHQCAIEPQDDLAKTYLLENWESGLMSGYFFICRRARRMPPPPILLYDLTGSLRSVDMTGLVKAAERAAAELFEQPSLASESESWSITVKPSLPVTSMD